MEVKILLAHKVFKHIVNVAEVVAETTAGSFGLLPQRLDCVAVLVPGILMVETEDGTRSYLALDEGLLVKAGNLVLISVHRAVGNAALGDLRVAVERDFKSIHDQESRIRTAVAKLESGFLHQFENLNKD